MNNTMQGTGWINYGDPSFTTYGGCLARPRPDTGSVFDILYADPETDEEGMLFAALITVDLSDPTIEPEAVMEGIGLEGSDITDMPPMAFAKEAAQYYRTALPSESYQTDTPYQWEDYLVTTEELSAWMCSLGAGQFAGD